MKLKDILNSEVVSSFKGYVLADGSTVIVLEKSAPVRKPKAKTENVLTFSYKGIKDEIYTVRRVKVTKINRDYFGEITDFEGIDLDKKGYRHFLLERCLSSWLTERSLETFKL